MFREKQVTGGDGHLNLASGPAARAPMLMLHGVGRCWQDYASLIPSLLWRWQIHGLDFRGHGGSQFTPGHYLVRDYVRDAVAVIRGVIAKPLVVYGHSLGAMVAATVAAEVPDLVRAVVLEEPPFDLLGPNIRQTTFYSMFAAMRSFSGSTLPVDELTRVIGQTRVDAVGKPEGVRLDELRDPVGLRFMAGCLRRVDPTLWDPLLAGQWLDGIDPVDVLKSIRCPVLLLQGEIADGSMMLEESGPKIESLVADCTRARVAGAGHLIHGFQPTITLRLVHGFLEPILWDMA